MKVELKIYGNDDSIQEVSINDASVKLEADVVEVEPVDGYRCYERLPTSRVMIQGVAHANSLSSKR